MLRHAGGVQPVQQEIRRQQVGVAEKGPGGLGLRLAEQNLQLLQRAARVPHDTA